MSNCREKRKKLGLCTDCGGKPADGYYRCDKCRQTNNAAALERRRKRIEKNVCLKCDEPCYGSHRRCKMHYEEEKQYFLARKLKLRSEGLCENCGAKPGTYSKDRQTKFLCTDCYFRMQAQKHLGTGKRWKELADLFARQNKCPYTGYQLAIGENASIDHIIPKCHGGSNQIDNIQFVYCSGEIDINYMKGMMDDMTFRAIVNVIHDNITSSNT